MEKIRHPVIMTIASLAGGGGEIERKRKSYVGTLHTHVLYLCLCYFVVMVRELEVHSSCVNVSLLSKNITES